MNKSSMQTVGALSGIAGFCIVGYFGSWLVAIGVFIMIFGNNVERRSQRIQ